MNDRQRLFDRWAASYDLSTVRESFPSLGYRTVLQTVVRLAEVGPGERLLDVGIGTGSLAERIAVADGGWDDRS